MISHIDRRNQIGSFDPVGFTVVPPRRFEDLRVGEVFRAPSRTLIQRRRVSCVYERLVSILKEVHAGDTLYPQLEIIKLTTQGDTGIVTTQATVHNQRGELVLDGEHTYSLKAASAHEK
jgi:hypothetical protein